MHRLDRNVSKRGLESVSADVIVGDIGSESVEGSNVRQRGTFELLARRVTNGSRVRVVGVAVHEHNKVLALTAADDVIEWATDICVCDGSGEGRARRPGACVGGEFGVGDGPGILEPRGALRDSLRHIGRCYRETAELLSAKGETEKHGCGELVGRQGREVLKRVRVAKSA